MSQLGIDLLKVSVSPPPFYVTSFVYKNISFVRVDTKFFIPPPLPSALKT